MPVLLQSMFVVEREVSFIHRCLRDRIATNRSPARDTSHTHAEKVSQRSCRRDRSGKQMPRAFSPLPAISGRYTGTAKCYRRVLDEIFLPRWNYSFVLLVASLWRRMRKSKESTTIPGGAGYFPLPGLMVCVFTVPSANTSRAMYLYRIRSSQNSLQGGWITNHMTT